MIWIVVLILLAGLGLLAVLTVWGKRRGISPNERARMHELWNTVELLMAEEHEAVWAKAVFEADKLLDQALMMRGIVGANLGERLKNGAHLFSNVQAAWDAHKLRNRLAHEVDARLLRHEAERAVSLFRDSLRQLGAL